MKTIAILMLSALVSSVALAGENNSNLCTNNLSKIAQYRATEAMTMGEPGKSRVHELRVQAEEYQKLGEIKSCISSTEQALLILKQHSSR